MKTSAILSFSLIFCLFIANSVFAGREAPGTGVGAAKTEGPSVESAPAQMPDLQIAHTPAGRGHHLIDPDALKVLSLMEKRVTDRQLLKKIRDKLPELGEDRLRMLASLSDEVNSENRGAKTDFAFLVLTTLIIFS